MARKINPEEQLDKFISNKTMNSIQEIIIIQNEHGEYELFNKYNIRKVADKEYLVTMPGYHFEHTFYTLRNAVVWCTCDKRNKIIESSRIVDLDLRLNGIEANMEVHRRLFKRAKDDDTKLIYIAKLNSDKIKKSDILRELTGYIEESRAWQLKKFNAKPEQ